MFGQNTTKLSAVKVLLLVVSVKVHAKYFLFLVLCLLFLVCKSLRVFLGKGREIGVTGK